MTPVSIVTQNRFDAILIKCFVKSVSGRHWSPKITEIGGHRVPLFLEEKPICTDHTGNPIWQPLFTFTKFTHSHDEAAETCQADRDCSKRTQASDASLAQDLCAYVIVHTKLKMHGAKSFCVANQNGFH